MSTSHEVQGIIHSIGDTKEFGQNGFTKRDFVIKLTGEGENVAYPNHTTFELIKDKCAMIDAYNLGDEINVAFNVTGRLWTGPDSVEKCFNSLKAWRIQSSGSNQNPHQSFEQNFDQSAGQNSYQNAPYSPPTEVPGNFSAGDDDIPF